MKPVTDALNRWIQTFVVHKTFKQFKVYLTPSGGIAHGVFYSMLYGTVPDRHHNSNSNLLAFNFNTNPKENKIEVRIVLAKPSVMSDCTSNYEIICCENLTCKDIIAITEYVKKNFTDKIMEVYYKYNPANYKHPDKPIEDFKKFYPSDYNLVNGFIEGCKSLIIKTEAMNKRLKAKERDF